MSHRPNKEDALSPSECLSESLKKPCKASFHSRKLQGHAMITKGAGSNLRRALWKLRGFYRLKIFAIHFSSSYHRHSSNYYKTKQIFNFLNIWRPLNPWIRSVLIVLQRKPSVASGQQMLSLKSSYADLIKTVKIESHEPTKSIAFVILIQTLSADTTRFIFKRLKTF